MELIAIASLDPTTSLTLLTLLLIILIVALICIIVLRDRRELKTKQIADDLAKLGEVAESMEKIKNDLTPALSAFKKYEATLTQIEGQLRQFVAAGAAAEHHSQPAGVVRERQDDRRDRDRGPRQPGKGKGWSGNRPGNKRRDFNAPQGEKDDTVTIDDGGKIARVSELAANGMTSQEIAKKLNVGQDEVAMVLELKGKKPV